MPDDRGMFKHIRVQILYPCNAKCSWCATHRKNPLFSEMYKDGISKQVHDFYVQIIKRFRPQQVFISGGEPLLYPGVARFLNDIKDATKQINLFTSYQFSQKLRQRMSFEQMPLDKMLICPVHPPCAVRFARLGGWRRSVPAGTPSLPRSGTS